jgi:hypothetical protein
MIFERFFYLFMCLFIGLASLYVSANYFRFHLLKPLLASLLADMIVYFVLACLVWAVFRFLFRRSPPFFRKPIEGFLETKKAQYLNWETRKIRQIKETIKASPKTAYNRIFTPADTQSSLVSDTAIDPAETIKDKAEYVRQRSGQLATIKLIYSEILGKNFD